MWALGCILLEMTMGVALWDLGFEFGIKAIEEPHFIVQYINDKVPEKFNPKIKQILKKMLNPEP